MEKLAIGGKEIAHGPTFASREHFAFDVFEPVRRAVDVVTQEAEKFRHDEFKEFISREGRRAEEFVCFEELV